MPAAVPEGTSPQLNQMKKRPDISMPLKGHEAHEDSLSFPPDEKKGELFYGHRTDMHSFGEWSQDRNTPGIPGSVMKTRRDHCPASKRRAKEEDPEVKNKQKND
jgi:hypothetical protein